MEWPVEEIALTGHEIDASLFLAASAASEVLWPERSDFGGASRFGTLRLVDQREPPEHDETGRDPP